MSMIYVRLLFDQTIIKLRSNDLKVGFHYMYGSMPSKKEYVDVLLFVRRVVEQSSNLNLNLMVNTNEAKLRLENIFVDYDVACESAWKQL